MALILFTYRPLEDHSQGAGLRFAAPEAGQLSQPELRAVYPDAGAIVCLVSDRIDAQVLGARPALRVVASVGAGYDQVDLEAADALGVLVCNVVGVVEETTADLAMGLIIAASRGTTGAERTLRAGGWASFQIDGFLGTDVHGAVLGLVGFGRIGQAVAARARGFGMRVLHHTRHPTGEAGWIASLDELLGQVDVVSLHVPRTADTVGLIGRRELGLLKPTAVLVNTARGAIVDEDALVDALEAGRLFGAGLDVYANEPGLNPRLLSCPGLTLLPHIGSATRATRVRMERSAVDAAATALRGDLPATAINAAHWRRRDMLV